MIVSYKCQCGNSDPGQVKFHEGLAGYEALVCMKCASYCDHLACHPADNWSRDYVGLKQESVEGSKDQLGITECLSEDISAFIGYMQLCYDQGKSFTEMANGITLQFDYEVVIDTIDHYQKEDRQGLQYIYENLIPKEQRAGLFGQK